jgi:hypothetical protein
MQSNFGTGGVWGFVSSGGSGGGGGTPLTFISVTKAQLDTRISGSTLVPGSFYKITDRGDQGILVQATSANTITNFGVRYMLVPSTYEAVVDGSGNDWIGVWSANKSAAAGQLAIWGGLVWTNTSGNIGTADDQATLSAADWTLITKAANPNVQYMPKQFSINYDYANDWIDRQWDEDGNVMGIAFLSAPLYGLPANPVDMGDWNIATNGVWFYGNVCAGVFNNSIANSSFLKNNTMPGYLIYANDTAAIFDNTTKGHIFNNTFNSGQIDTNSNNGDISGNQVLQIGSNSNNGPILSNVMLGFPINFNTNNGSITANQAGGSIDLNSNNGNIGGNTTTDAIRRNQNNGNITSNACVSVTGNRNDGNINSNTASVGGINNNANTGDINSNDNEGNISNNLCVGEITGNSNGSGAFTGGIENNNNTGSILANDNGGTITGNSNSGSISINQNTGNIESNSNNGSIEDNTNTVVNITQNVNNGGITTNSASIGTISITTNTNNGDISGAFAADVTDPVVDKN